MGGLIDASLTAVRWLVLVFGRGCCFVAVAFEVKYYFVFLSTTLLLRVIIPLHTYTHTHRFPFMMMIDVLLLVSVSFFVKPACRDV